MTTEHYRLIHTVNPCNSYAPDHWFNFQTVTESDDFDELMTIMKHGFGSNKSFGYDSAITMILNQENLAVGMFARLPLQDQSVEYFRLLPVEDVLEPKVSENSLVPYCTKVGGVDFRAYKFDVRTLLGDGEAVLANHPVYKQIKSEFDPLTPEQIEKLIDNPL